MDPYRSSNTLTDQQCSYCRKLKAISEFPPRKKDTKDGKKGEPSAKCRSCMDKQAESQRVKRHRESIVDHSEPDKAYSVEEFLRILKRGIKEPQFRMKMKVTSDHSSLPAGPSGTLKERAVKLAEVVDDCTKYH
ncbi:hypothetical protein K474DRAFT_1709850 [Panus rudis PR-1116 ss-1]|nr:hypothetical protein K474DRAFT_1709850 [Panus rudis PR-1116 ss-1]